MIVAFDASLLIYLLDENAAAPSDPATGEALTDCKARVEYLLGELQKVKAKIVVPAPALAEVLVYAPQAAPEWLRILANSKHFRIASFDALAAVEFAARERARIVEGKRHHGGPRAKAKFDHQIVAIAAVERATSIYSDDDDIRKLVDENVHVIGISELPLPPIQAQGRFDLVVGAPDEPGDESEE